MRKLFRKIYHWHSLWQSGLSTRPGVTVVSPQSLSLGRNCHIGTGSFLDARGGLEIGDGTIFSDDVAVLTYNHNLRDRRLLPYDERIEKKKVLIGRGCWLGRGVLVAPGATIGVGAAVGMGTVVAGIVADNTLVVGNPHRQVRELAKVDREYRAGGRRSSLFQIIRYVRFRGI